MNGEAGALAGDEAAPMHWLTIDLGNFCGQPSSEPHGGQATSDPTKVTCQDCLDQAMLDLIGSGEPGDDFTADRHADLDAGEAGGAMTDADFYDRTAPSTGEG